jgi:ubiquinone/menaquinone biosynthesis C-methylase UbiE
MKTFDVKSSFPQESFLRLDLRQAFGADILRDIERLSFQPHSVGTLLCIDTIEHVWDLQAVFKEVDRVLRKDGITVISSVFNFKIHRCPRLALRFMSEHSTYGIGSPVVG